MISIRFFEKKNRDFDSILKIVTALVVAKANYALVMVKDCSLARRGVGGSQTNQHSEIIFKKMVNDQ